MSSILTNEGATTALATLRNINAQIAQTQNEISTGKRTADPSSNGAVWSISKTMRADIAGFKTVSASLSLGQATLSVARQGAETITELLSDMKTEIVASQEANVDRSKIQNKITALREQIDGIVATAAFNGQNLLKNTETTAGSGVINVLGSIDRGEGSVSSTHLTFNRRDMGTGVSAVSGSGGDYTEDAVTQTLNATQSATLDMSSLEVEAGAAFSFSIYGTDANDSTFTQDDYRTTTGASETQAQMATSEISYVARDGDSIGDVAKALKRAWDDYAAGYDLSTDVLDVQVSGESLVVSSTVTDGTDTIRTAINTLSADAGSTIGGGLEAIGEIDVTDNTGAAKALSQIEGLINYAIDAAAAFGSDQGRIETQSEFVGKITATLQDGVGQLEDADMEDTSARLQALQVQQQLAVQALSIANAAPRQLLALFR
ncbi:flagellin [Pacificoceanicola onchidii]|uniref:flagellin n=1 Tax=Pacificoceanicola onchidii TaxID=2562685 RepID=UPI0010A696B8|nr:flagellin [Pacificoceanicola onchidii]